ncbi:DNA helicase II [Immundisolibacter sp.]|uniref:DNA helicase II n=1 Tax=Immundisolibacter sp. TaxID=1934948 RepID=UPI003561795D
MTSKLQHLTERLNPPQHEAVTTPGPTALVLAGAGSGKTRVLTHRIAWLIEIERASPLEILAVTFTNKAAAQMREQIGRLVPLPPRGMWVGTFHGIAHRLLRAHWREAGLPETFQILDSDDQQRLIKRLLKEVGNDQHTPGAVQSFINARKDEGQRARHVDPQGFPDRAELAELYRRYEAACERGGMVDFGELLLRSNDLWVQQPALRDHYRRRFRHILVDEFQDTNALQYAWLCNLAGPETSMFAVGDDDQAIYGWRGAKVENMRDFERQFAACKVIRLEQNYRSTSTILSAANALIAHNRERLGKNLWSDAGTGEPIRLYAAYNEQDEARFVVEQIEAWAAAGNPRAEAAILYRSNAQSRAFEEALMVRRIKYRVYGGQRFFDRAEIRDALAYLRLVANPADDTAFERVVNQPPRGIGDKTLETLRSDARAHNLPVWEVLCRLLRDGGLSGRAATALGGFHKLIEDLRAASQGQPLTDQATMAIRDSGLMTHYSKDTDGRAEGRIENLDELVNAASLFVNEEEDLDELTAFLSHAALEAGDAQGEAGDDCVQLMTLHSAKGLEFRLVFLGGVEEGLFPSQRSLEDPTRLEEERRLAYVGLTRARERLFITYAESRRIHGETRPAMASRFVGEIPAEFLTEVRLRGTVSQPVAARPSRGYGDSFGKSRPDWTHSNNAAQALPVAARTRPKNTWNVPAKVPEKSDSGLWVGQSVRHGKFGEGIITDLEGQGPRTRVQVKFAAAGSKWLMLDMAGLVPA